MVFSILTTNLFALYIFTSPPKNHTVLYHAHKNISLIYETIDLSRPNIANELKLFLQHHKLPLGKDSRTGITEMVAFVGQVYFQEEVLCQVYFQD
ncbi:unnamed protein product [Camellia sinensis]